MIPEAFLYIWYDSIEKMFYLGYHKGTAYDNYGQSSSVLMEGYNGNKPWRHYEDAPPHFKRRILAWGTSLEMAKLENKCLMNRSVISNPKYYNKSYGNPQLRINVESLIITIRTKDFLTGITILSCMQD